MSALVTEVKAYVAGSLLRVETRVGFDGGSFPLADTVTRQVIDLENAAVKAALIELGWTPPEEKACGKPL